MNALANPEVGTFINANFVSSFQKVATFRIVNGQKQGGNVAAYFCSPDGRVLHCVAGPVDAGTMLREAKWVVDAVKKANDFLKTDKTKGMSFKTLFRSWHSERLRNEFGIVVEPVTFDAAEAQNEDSALTYNDPSGRPLVPILPPPPIDGPDVNFKPREEAKRALADAASAAEAWGGARLKDKAGRGIGLGTQGRVHILLAAHSLVKIDKVYGTVFESILGEKVTTRPVELVDARAPSHHELCLHCAALKAQAAAKE